MSFDGSDTNSCPRDWQKVWRDPLIQSSNAQPEYPPVCVHRLFEEQVRRTPAAVAVIEGERRLTYDDLNSRANQQARYLRTLGVGPDSLVGICSERSIELIIALMAVLKAGGAYVPLEPGLPAERLEFMIQDMGPSALLCARAFLGTFSACCQEVVTLDNLAVKAGGLEKADTEFPEDPASLAYVLYTSGSTGQPKGVLVTHSALVNYLSWCTYAYPVTEGCGSPLHTPIGFDLTITSLFPALLAGGSVVLINEDHGLQELAAALSKQPFSVVKLTPSHLEVLRDSPAGRIQAKAFVIGGEALYGETLAYVREKNPGVRLFNEYGPTEATVGCCVYEVPNGPVAPGPVPIGRPIFNVQLHILDPDLTPVPIGNPGELYIGGRGLAKGYHRRPDLTAEKFIRDPFSTEPNARLYKTGDLVRCLPDGNLEYLGRLDDQVKIRGYRIELREIESVLREHPGVRDAVACPHGALANRHLVACLAIDADRKPSEVDLRSFLQQRLPEYMLPSAYILMDRFPLTINGKVDRLALAAVQPRQPGSFKAAAPRDSVESRLLAIWGDVLQVSAIGLRDNFFDLGGQSLAAARLVTRIEKEFEQRLAPSVLFQAPTVEELACVLRHGKVVTDLRISAIQPAGSDPPFFCMGAGPLFRILAACLGTTRPFLGVNTTDYANLRHPVRLEDLAGNSVDAIRHHRPNGPYLVGGWSDAGVIAYEVAQQLQRQGQKVSQLVLFDTENESEYQRPTGFNSVLQRLDGFRQWVQINWRLLRDSDRREAARRIREGLEFRRYWLRELFMRVVERVYRRHGPSTGAPVDDGEFLVRRAVAKYAPLPYDGPVLLFRRTARPRGPSYDETFGWGKLCKSLEIVEIPGDHKDMFLEPIVRILGKELGSRLHKG
ncbi:MAG TPA: amino acid adenylation domain-containing protein [Candidatus Acidoferrales bacterium]|nr:amino acid adenylation domain-containing protein [Candidatus Acidoferrales bacterium]